MAASGHRAPHRRTRNPGISLCRLAILSFMVVLLAATGSSDAGPDTSAGRPKSCDGARAAIKTRLSGLVSSQTPSGGIVFSKGDDVLVRHPMLATLGLDVYRHDHDAYTLQRIHNASSQYAAYLLGRADSDGDFVLERASWANHAHTGSYEDPGFNALFALDLLNLSRICTELNRPVDALYWYQGTQTISRQLIHQTYDNPSRFFLPMNNAIGHRENLYYGLSVMPTHFDGSLGDNLSMSILSHYLLKNQSVAPDPPHRYLDWTPADGQTATALSPTRVLRTALLLGALDHRGMTEARDRYAAQIRGAIAAQAADRNAFDSTSGRAYVDYFSCLIASGDYRDLYPRYYELDLFAAVSSLAVTIPENELAQLEHDVSVVKHFLLDSSGKPTPDDPEGELAAIETSMRQIYWMISSLRKDFRTRSLFTPRDRRLIPGFDVYAAFGDLFDNVIAALHDVETKLSSAKAEADGFVISPTALNESIVFGEPVRFRLAVHTMNRPVDIKSIVVFRDQTPDTLTTAPLVRLEPGDEPREYWYQFLPAGDHERLEQIRLSIEVRLADNRRLKYHYSFGVYISHPISFAVAFPQGKIIRGGSLPVEIVVTKHVNRPYLVNAEWYSNAGVNPVEGRSFELSMPEETRSGTFKMRILVPEPCRPGDFPFVVKVYGNGKEVGTVSASLFKHYEWLFVGPFPAKEGLLNVSYPPERSLNFRESYPGAIRPISWMTLPARSYQQNGEINLTPLLPVESVGYLNTVVETPLKLETTITLSSALPVVVFVNRKPVLRLDDSMLGSPQHAPVTLEAGTNNILIKLLSGEASTLSFQLGEGKNMTPDEFNNDLSTLVDGFQDLRERSLTGVTGVKGQRVVTLTYRDANAGSVAVIGSFNGWSPVNTGMRRTGGDQWEISLHLLPGRYAYRFLVDNSMQVLDPTSPLEEPDGYGGMNSVLDVR